ncbi:MAG TPA: PadR family transcriptional regulator [Myxococcota bacterium]|jgi:DNA-binding PadR family transcriptional regulator
MSTTRMLVLGVVKMFQPVHGYDVRRELLEWHVDEWARVAPGSIYNALKTLTKEGLLKSAGTDQIGGRPERTLFKITPVGERELDTLLRETLWQWSMPIDPLVSVMSLMGFLKRDDLIAGLQARAAKIRGDALANEHAINAIDDDKAPLHVREMLRLIHARVSAELGWSEAFIKRLRAGQYRTADDPPWRSALATPGSLKERAYQNAKARAKLKQKAKRKSSRLRK